MTHLSRQERLVLALLPVAPSDAAWIIDVPRTMSSLHRRGLVESVIDNYGKRGRWWRCTEAGRAALAANSGPESGA